MRGLSPLIRKYHLDFSSVPNEHVLAQLKPGETYHRLTRAACDCGTALGSLAFGTEGRGRTDGNLERKMKKLRDKGWSQAKIERWLSQHEKADDRRRKAADEATLRLREGGMFTARRWIEVLAELVSSGYASSVGLLIHWYSGTVEGERIVITKRQPVSLAKVNAEFMMNMEHDVLYEFAA